MATKASIEFDFQQAKRQADALDQLANRLSQLSGRDFAEAMQDISTSWQGQNARLYLSKGSKLQGKMNESVKALHTVANNIRTVAKRMHDAEMNALRIAESRTYHT